MLHYIDSNWNEPSFKNYVKKTIVQEELDDTCKPKAFNVRYELKNAVHNELVMELQNHIDHATVQWAVSINWCAVNGYNFSHHDDQ